MTVLIFAINVHGCGISLKPFMDLMVSETMRGVMQTLYKSTLRKTLISRQAVDAVVLAKDLLPPVKM